VGAWNPEQRLSADTQLISAEVTPAPRGMPELTIADTELVEADSLNCRYE
jgi:hypothetical protein